MVFCLPHWRSCAGVPRAQRLSRHILASSGIPRPLPLSSRSASSLFVSSFRLASTQRRYDKETEKWIDGETNWFTITCFRQLATNVVRSVNKGERVIVRGALRIREWGNGENVGRTVELEAETMGHDLVSGISVFSRSTSELNSADEASV